VVSKIVLGTSLENVYVMSPGAIVAIGRLSLGCPVFFEGKDS